MVALKRGVDAGGSTLASPAWKFVWVGSLSQLPGGALGPRHIHQRVHAAAMTCACSVSIGVLDYYYS